MNKNAIRSFLRTRKMTAFYAIFFIVITVTLGYIGCSEVENNLVQSPQLGIHPPGWGSDTGSSSFHGKYIFDNNAWDLTQCKSCHGGDYKGGTTDNSCLTCHTSSGGPQNCRLCHGGVSGRSSPPKALNGSTSINYVGVGVHVYHLDSTKYSKPVECNECHLPLTGGFNSPNHIGDNPDGIAEVVFGPFAMTSIGGGITPDPVWDRNTLTCSNSYCHGDFINGNRNAAPVWTDPGSVKCGSCHGNPVTGNPNPRDSTGAYTKPHFSFFTSQTCYVCHGSVINPSGVIYNKDLHVNGVVND
jgi:predicted CxxxxCH...CXXCH cytochrome family protein